MSLYEIWQSSLLIVIWTQNCCSVGCVSSSLTTSLSWPTVACAKHGCLACDEQQSVGCSEVVAIDVCRSLVSVCHVGGGRNVLSNCARTVVKDTSRGVDIAILDVNVSNSNLLNITLPTLGHLLFCIDKLPIVSIVCRCACSELLGRDTDHSHVVLHE
jgi:hypothetical protein